MRVAFAGTPPFAARALEAILEAGHVVPLVLSQPDRPSGRGMKLVPSAVASLAKDRGLALHQPATLKTAESRAPLLEARPDVLVVAAYGLILPQAVLDIPPRGCLNIHASLLPRWRGAAPIHRAILAGDRETGVGIMLMEAGLDTGPVLLEKRLAIEPGKTTGSLTARLADLGAEAIVEALAGLDRLVARPQDPAAAIYAAKVEKSEAQIQWSRSSLEIVRKINAFNPSPGAETRLAGQLLKVWEATSMERGPGIPGEVLGEREGALIVACGEGAVAITLLQSPGSRRLSAGDFLRGHPVPPGTLLGGDSVAKC